MKDARIFVLLLVLISFLFIINSIKDDIVVHVDKLTSKGVLDTKAALSSLGVSIIIDDGPPEIYIDSPKSITYTTTTVDLKFTIIDLDLDKIYYNIDNGTNITITGNTSFTTTIGSHTLYLYANDSLGQLNSSSVAFSIISPQSGGPSGGGGGGRSITITPNFILSTDFIKISLLQGETKREVIEIKNTGSNVLDLTVDLQNLKDFLIFPGGSSNYNLRLNPGETQFIQLIFSAAKDYEPGIYAGGINIKSSSVTKTITTIIEVESLKKIFDVDIEIADKEVVKGTKLIAEIILFNLGESKERVDVDIEYGIKDLRGNIIYKQDLIIAVETQVSFVEDVFIPKNLENGRYVFYTIAKFEGQVGTATELFEVISSPTKYLELSRFYIYIILTFILIMIILIIIKFLKHSHTRKRRLEKYGGGVNVYGELEKAIRAAREQGFKDFEIKKELINKGWIKEEIEYIMRRIK